VPALIRLLLLRVFSPAARVCSMLAAMAPWAKCLIAGPDLATSGRAARISRLLERETWAPFHSATDLAQRLSETEQRRFTAAARDFFCHDDTWQMVLKRLARDGDWC
jgi:hypothetical protein